MKKILLGTTALVSAGLLAQQAQADASVTGSATVGMYVAGGSSIKDQTGLKFEQDAGVTFDGSTTLDNGLDVGFSLSTESSKQTVINVEGGFGKIALGYAHSAAKQGQKKGPWVNGFFSANSGSITQREINSGPAKAGMGLVNAGTGLNEVAGESNSIMYFSPAFSGFSFSVSYTPDSADDASNKDPSVGGALGYSGDASMGIGVDAGAGWVRRTNPDEEATTGTNFGITVSMEGASIGSSYSTIVRGDVKKRSYDVAFKYSLGNGVTAGLGWIHHNIQGNAFFAIDEDGNTKAGRGNGYRVQAAYDLGPGVTVNAALGADNYTRTGQPKEDGTLVGLALAASF